MKRLKKVWQKLRRPPDDKSGLAQSITWSDPQSGKDYDIGADVAAPFMPMGNMRAQVDWRNAARPGSFEAALAQQNLFAQAFATQRAQAMRGIATGIPGGLQRLLGDAFGSGKTVFSSGPTISKPKTELKIPIQEPTGKRRIKLRD